MGLRVSGMGVSGVGRVRLRGLDKRRIKQPGVGEWTGAGSVGGGGEWGLTLKTKNYPSDLQIVFKNLGLITFSETRKT